MIGKIFGRLTVVAFVGNNRHGGRMWECSCACGNKTTAVTAQLNNGHTKSCGCLVTDTVTARNKTHGHTARKFSGTYHSWSGMVARCTNPKRASWEHYGGRGITVDQSWLKFENFLADMGERPDGMSLDRVDVNGNYGPENCRWADRITQARNSTQTIWVTLDGVRKMLIEWCEIRQISLNTVRDRVKHYGMTYEDAITTPRQLQAYAKIV